MKSAWIAASALVAATTVAAQAPAKPVYRCPGPPVLYTDAITPADAKSRNCRAIEGAPITVVQSTRRTAPADAAPARAATAPAAGASARPGDTRVEPAAQKQRDTDSKRILESELRREEDAMAALKRDFNNGEPERRGEERNYAKYQERVAEMKAAIGRKEADIAALKRELAKLSP